MRVTQFLFMTALALSLGAGNILAQSLTPRYIPAAPYYAADASPDVASLEYRLSTLEDAMSKKVDKPDTKKGFDVKIDGRAFFESVAFGDPQVKEGDFEGQSDYTGFREAHLGFGGSGFGILDYRMEVTFKSGNTEFNDVYLGVKNVPGLDYVRIGHYKVETGMVQVGSALNTTAMETTTATQAFSPGRRVGIGQTYYFADENVRWFNGIFGSGGVGTGKFYTASDLGIIYNSRLTFVPYYAQEGAKYFHFGGHYMYREDPLAVNPEDGEAEPFSLSPVRIGGFSRATAGWFTPKANAQDYHQGGLEAAWGHGRLAVTSELFAGTFGSGRDLYGGYVEVRYFLTGDHRPYNKRNGVIGGVKTKKNFLTGEDFIQTCHGTFKGFTIESLGAWEVYTQWIFTDSDRVYAVDEIEGGGGRSVDTVLGLNWYWNPNVRMMFEYVHSDGTINGRTDITNIETGVITRTPYQNRATEDIIATGLRFNF